MKSPAVSNKELLSAFERTCNKYGVVSAGFDRNAITAPIDGEKHDGKDRWAMHYSPDWGWMIVCGKGGCGSQFTRAAGYVKGKWNFLMLIEALFWAHIEVKKESLSSHDA